MRNEYTKTERIDVTERSTGRVMATYHTDGMTDREAFIAYTTALRQTDTERFAVHPIKADTGGQLPLALA